jgi:hypothetical protein
VLWRFASLRNHYQFFQRRQTNRQPVISSSGTKPAHFFGFDKQEAAYPPAKGDGDEGSTLGAAFFAYKTKRQLCISRGFLI